MNRIMLILLIITALAFVVSSQILSGVTKDVVKKIGQLDAIALEKKNLPMLENLVSSNSEKISIIAHSFPKKEELVSVVQTIDTLSAINGVSASLHFEKEEPLQEKSGAFVLPVTITVEGKLANSIDFIAGLKKNRYLFTLEKVEARASGGLRGVNTVIVAGKLYVAEK